jgi:membrane protein YqaA with SNARE-associated domain
MHALGLLLLAPAAHAAHANAHLMQLFLRYGLIGLFLVSIVDSSFVPLPIPGITDIMLVLYGGQHENPFLLVTLATAGSFLGGWFSYRVGQSGGMAFIEKRTPPRIYKKVCGWMESHAILAVALPAVLPPPMPLSPFVLAAGALKMSLRKFNITFTVSRLVRHAAAVVIGILYGRHFLRLWFKFSDKYGAPILIVLWSFILISVGVAFWQLWKTSRSIGAASSLQESKT